MRRLEPPAVKKRLYDEGKDTTASAGTLIRLVISYA